MWCVLAASMAMISRGTAGVTLSDEDWLAHVDIGAAVPGQEPEIITTSDDRITLVMCGASGINKFAEYNVNVTQLPRGKTNFPVLIEIRNVCGRDTGIGIFNASLSPEGSDYLDPFSTWWGAGVEADEPTEAGSQDSSGAQARDGQGSIGDPVGRADDATVSSEDVPFGVIDTSTGTTTLELALGENRIIIQPVDGEDLPGLQKFNPGWQVVSITIGPDDPDLRGQVAPPDFVFCRATRSTSTALYNPGGTVRLTVSARNVAGPTVLTETFPPGWTVVDPGGGTVDGNQIAFDGGTVDGNQIAFDLAADGVVAYSLEVPQYFCDTASFTGELSGAGGCGAVVDGESEIACLGTASGGIVLAGDTFLNFADRGAENPGEEPRVVTTTDGVQTLVTPNLNSGANKFVTYAVNVTSLPPGVNKFRVLVEGRTLNSGNAGIGIRNHTLSPDDYPDGVWWASELKSASTTIGAVSQDSFARVDQEQGTLGKIGQDVNDATLAVLENPFGTVVSESTTLELELGLNELVLQPVDAAGLPGLLVFDSGWQIGRLVIGPNQPGLEGQVVRRCTVTRELENDFYVPGSAVAVTLRTTNISGPTTVREEFPQGWVIADDGGGTVDASRIKFDVASDTELRYVLTSPDTCGLSDFAGTYSGPEALCDGEISGVSTLECCPLGDFPLRVDIGPSRQLENLALAPNFAAFEGAENLELQGAVTSCLSGVAITIDTAAPANNSRYSDFGEAGDLLRDFVHAENTTGPGQSDQVIRFVNLPAGGYVLTAFHNDASGAEHDPITTTASGDVTNVEDGGVFAQSVLQTEPDDLENSPEVGRSKVLFDTSGTGPVELRYTTTGVGTGPAEDVVLNGFILATAKSEDPALFLRGDCNQDGDNSGQVTDALFLLNFLFQGAAAPRCLAACDMDADGQVSAQVTDVVFFLNFNFLGGAPLAPPVEACGPLTEPGDIALGCADTKSCSS